MVPSIANLFSRSNLVRSDVSGRTPPSPAGTRPRPPPTPASSGAPPPLSSSHGGKHGIGLARPSGARRHRKVLRDNIMGITKGDLRRLARRGGVKRISATIYREAREVVKRRLEDILRQLVTVLDCSGRKTVQVNDVVFVLNRMGKPIWIRNDEDRVYVRAFVGKRQNTSRFRLVRYDKA